MNKHIRLFVSLLVGICTSWLSLTYLYANSLDSLCYATFKSRFKECAGLISPHTFKWSENPSLGSGELVLESPFRDLIPYRTPGADIRQSRWFPGEKVEMEQYDILHLSLVQHPTMLYGPIWVDELVMTFRKDGIPLDARIVSRNIDYQSARIEGVVRPYKLHIAYEYRASTFGGEKLKEYVTYSTSADGKILREKTPLNPSLFLQEIRKFRPITQPKIDWYSFSATAQGDQENPPRLADNPMSPLFAEHYMPIIDKTRPWRWYWGGLYAQPSYIILLTHGTGESIGWEESGQLAWVLSTVSPQGELIDQVVLGVDTPSIGIRTFGNLPNEITVDSYNLPPDRSDLTNMQVTYKRDIYSVDTSGKIRQNTLFFDETIHRDSLLLSNRLLNPKY